MLNTVLSFTFMDLFNPRNKPVRLMGLLLLLVQSGVN